MSETFKFPNGYDVNICRKKDILDCIDDNILDKDVALAIVSHCEFSAAKYIKDGIWAGIPFIGNIRRSACRARTASKSQQDILTAARETLDSDQYLLFKRDFYKDNAKRVAENRYYRYITSMAVTKNRKLYKHLCKTKGEVYARLFLYCSHTVTSVDNEYKLLDDELKTDNR